MTAISIEAKQLSIQKFWFPETLFEILISLINYSLLFSVESCPHQIFGVISIFTFSITWAYVVHRNGLLINDLLHTGIDASVLRCWLALLRDGKHRMHDQIILLSDVVSIILKRYCWQLNRSNDWFDEVYWKHLCWFSCCYNNGDRTPFFRSTDCRPRCLSTRLGCEWTMPFRVGIHRLSARRAHSLVIYA